MPSMSQPAEDSQDHRDDEEIVLGVDTHKDTHVAAVITILGVLVATATFPTTSAGYRQLLAWARSFGLVHRAGVEGTGSFGAALARYLRRQHIAVVEVNRPDRAARRRHGKTDTVDATAAAHAVLSARATSIAKTGDGPVEMLVQGWVVGAEASRDLGSERGLDDLADRGGLADARCWIWAAARGCTPRSSSRGAPAGCWAWTAAPRWCGWPTGGWPGPSRSIARICRRRWRAQAMGSSTLR